MATKGGHNPEPTGVNPRRCLVRKYMSIGLTTLLTASALICLVLASGADITGPPG